MVLYSVSRKDSIARTRDKITTFTSSILKQLPVLLDSLGQVIVKLLFHE